MGDHRLVERAVVRHLVLKLFRHVVVLEWEHFEMVNHAAEAFLLLRFIL